MKEITSCNQINTSSLQSNLFSGIYKNKVISLPLCRSFQEDLKLGASLFLFPRKPPGNRKCNVNS